jgi:hypothetical protein
MTREDILKTVESAGYRILKEETFLEDDTIFIYRISD